MRRPDSSYSGSLWFGTSVDICEGGSYHIDDFVEGTRVRCQSLSQGRGIHVGEPQFLNPEFLRRARIDQMLFILDIMMKHNG